MNVEERPASFCLPNASAVEGTLIYLKALDPVKM